MRFTKGEGKDRREKVGKENLRNDECRTAITKGTECLLDPLLRLGVYSTSRFIQENNSWMLEDSPRDGNSLQLSARELDPAFTDSSIVALMGIISTVWPKTT